MIAMYHHDEALREYRALIYWSVRFQKVRILIVHACTLIAKKALRLGRSDPYPESVSAAVKRVICEPIISPFNPKVVRTGFIDPSRSMLKVADGFFEYRKPLDWLRPFTDQEQYVALHRWGWLYHRIRASEEPVSIAWGEQLMHEWLSVMTALPKGVASETYTVGERIVHASLYYHFFDQLFPPRVPPDIIGALSEMAHHVAHNLEYRDIQQTCNHIIQNARALIFSGVILENPSLSKVGEEILYKTLGTMITGDGFLREGSTHYHFLFTRWLSEIVEILGRTGNSSLQLFIEYYLHSLVARCDFFLIFERRSKIVSFPLFGDVSPDCSPSFLLSLPYFASTQSNASAQSLSKREFQSFPNSGWYRLDLGAVTVFWHVQTSRDVQFPDHSHNDTGGFIVYRDGRPVLIDPGRPSYEKQSLFYEYSSSPRAHNTVTLDSLGVLPDRRNHRLPLIYQNIEVETKWTWLEESFVFEIMHRGFERRYRGATIHTRTFSVSRIGIRIQDVICGTGIHHIRSYFHWAPEITIEFKKTRGVISIEGAVFGLFVVDDVVPKVYRGSLAPLLGWVFSEYGSIKPTSTCVVERVSSLPIALNYELTWTKNE